MMTTQHREFAGLEVPADRRPGTLDVRWAEEALRRPHRTDHAGAIRRTPPVRRFRRAFRRVLAATALASCLAVGILIAPDDTAPVPPTPASAPARAPVATSTNPRSLGFSGLWRCPLGQPKSDDAIQRLALIPDLSCFGGSLGLPPATAASSGRG